jgi:hypothetical protein
MSAQPTHHATDDRLIDLAHGLLDPEESSMCLAHVGKCRTCEDRFRAIAGEHARLVAHAAPAPVGRRRPILVAAASLAALLVLGAALRFGRTSDAGPSPYWLPIEREQAVLRSHSDATAPADLARALAAYEKEDARLAARLLNEAEIPEEYEPLRDLYLASALALDGRAAEAAAVLDRLHIDTLPEPWRTQGRWVAYAIARARGDDDRAAALLERVARANGEIGDLARRERWRR